MLCSVETWAWAWGVMWAVLWATMWEREWGQWREQMWDLWWGRWKVQGVWGKQWAQHCQRYDSLNSLPSLFSRGGRQLPVLDLALAASAAHYVAGFAVALYLALLSGASLPALRIPYAAPARTTVEMARAQLCCFFDSKQWEGERLYQ